MYDCVQSTVIKAYDGAESLNLGLARCNSKPALLPILGIQIRSRDSSVTNFRNFRVSQKNEHTFMKHKVCKSLAIFASNGFDLTSELELDMRNDEKKLKEFIGKNGGGNKFGQSNFDVTQEEKKAMKERREGLKGEEDVFGIENAKNGDLKPKGKQLMRRSSLLAKQVIGIQSALSLGFVSQLWVDAKSWVVVEVEFRPNLLSSESGKFLLRDLIQVGDVMLVEDESVMLNEFKTVGLETLVGYNVVTPAQRNLGKVRGYTFNINSGAVESLELDAFGYSIIPSSLVSTYALFTEDVIEVVSDTIVVHEAAASHIQRLTKGFWGAKIMETPNINLKHRDWEEEDDEEYIRPDKGRKSRRKISKRKVYQGMRDLNNDLELPMDYM